MRLLASIRIIRVTLAVAVAFWTAGAGCMLGCENMVSAAVDHSSSAGHSDGADAAAGTNASAIVVSGDACASMKSHDCCAKRGKPSVAPRAKQSPAAEPLRLPSSKLTANSARDFKVRAFGNHARAHLDEVATEAAAPISTMRDCPLAVNATAALSKARPDESGSAIVLARAFAPSNSVQEQLAALAPLSALPNRGHTYLRCCVFLI
jgi:hypothetical protein